MCSGDKTLLQMSLHQVNGGTAGLPGVVAQVCLVSMRCPASPECLDPGHRSSLQQHQTLMPTWIFWSLSEKKSQLFNLNTSSWKEGCTMFFFVLYCVALLLFSSTCSLLINHLLLQNHSVCRGSGGRSLCHKSVTLFSTAAAICCSL